MTSHSKQKGTDLSSRVTLSHKDSIRRLQLDHPDWWCYRSTSEVLIRQFVEHVLALSVNYRRGDDIIAEVYSGFVVEITERFFWVTAAHVVNELQALPKHPNIEIISARWWDNCTEAGAETVPMDIGSIDAFAFDESESDIAFVRLGVLEATNILSAGGITPLTEKAWRSEEAAEPVGHYLVGFAHQDVKLDSRAHTVESSLGCIPIQEMNSSDLRDIGISGDDRTAFYGEIIPFSGEPRLPELDVKGMSGGPVLSIEPSEHKGLVYRLVGVQSKWFLPPHRIVVAGRFHRVVEAARQPSA